MNDNIHLIFGDITKVRSRSIILIFLNKTSYFLLHIIVADVNYIIVADIIIINAFI